jgi:hypothetical protein
MSVQLVPGTTDGVAEPTREHVVGRGECVLSRKRRVVDPRACRRERRVCVVEKEARRMFSSIHVVHAAPADRPLRQARGCSYQPGGATWDSVLRQSLSHRTDPIRLPVGSYDPSRQHNTDRTRGAMSTIRSRDELYGLLCRVSEPRGYSAGKVIFEQGEPRRQGVRRT